MDLQKMINSMAEASSRERSNYHLTFGDLIDALKKAKESDRLSHNIVGIGAYRGYYSDIVLCTKSGSPAYKTEFDYDSDLTDYDKWSAENTIEISLPENPHELSSLLESLIGSYLDGYKGGYSEITREKPLWIATDYGNCSDEAVVSITDDLEMITKHID